VLWGTGRGTGDVGRLEGLAEGCTATAGQRIGPLSDADITLHPMIYTASGNPLTAAKEQGGWTHTVCALL